MFYLDIQNVLNFKAQQPDLLVNTQEDGSVVKYNDQQGQERYSLRTIENKAGFPEGVQPGLSDRIYGCDICQDVCPYNRNASVHTIPEFLPSEQLKQLRKKDWIAMTEPEFDQLFAGSPVMRLGYDGLMRNIRVNS